MGVSPQVIIHDIFFALSVMFCEIAESRTIPDDTPLLCLQLAKEILYAENKKHANILAFITQSFDSILLSTPQWCLA